MLLLLLLLLLVLLFVDREFAIRHLATPLGAGSKGRVSHVGSRGGRVGGVPRAERASWVVVM